MLIFSFYEYPGEAVTGILTASAPSTGNFTFEWSAWDTLSMAYGAAFQTDNNATGSTVTGLDNGGYKVRVFNGAGIDTSFLVWVFIDDLKVNVDKTSSGEVPLYKYTCDLLNLSASVFPDTFYLYNPTNNEKIDKDALGKPINGYNVQWTSDNTDLNLSGQQKSLTPTFDYLTQGDIPFKDTWYFLEIVDSFGMTVRDSVFFHSVFTKAEFSFMFFDKADKKEFVEPPDPPEDGAPLEVKFTNESENGWSFEWIFSDSAKSGKFADEFTNDLGYEPEYTYYKPGDYYPALVSTSEAGCVDTFRVVTPITVQPSELKVQNVFSPNGDNLND